MNGDIDTSVTTSGADAQVINDRTATSTPSQDTGQEPNAAERSKSKPPSESKQRQAHRHHSLPGSSERKHSERRPSTTSDGSSSIHLDISAPDVSASVTSTDSELDLSEAADEIALPDSNWKWRAWLVSLIAHLLVMVILAIWTYRLIGLGSGDSIDGRFGDEGDVVKLEAADTPDDTVNFNAALAERPVEVDLSPNQKNQLSVSPTRNTQAVPIDATELANLLAGGADQANNRLSLLPGGGMGGRTPEGRIKYGDKYGATPASEQAVERALKWLAAHQRSDGSWSFDLNLDPCNGRCRHSRSGKANTPTPSTGATGLALLAFLGAGYTHETGPYAENVRRGIYYLRSVAAESEFGYDWQQGSMYGHGIALLALGEALAMTKIGDSNDAQYDSDLMNLVKKGSFFTAVAQHKNGSWGYNPGSPGDTTLTGWQVLSLIGAKRCGIDLRSNTLPRAKEFLLSVAPEHTFSFGYRDPKPERTTTAIGLTLMMYLGQTPGFTPFDDAVGDLAARGPTLTNVYHDYYATMALHHWRHPDWEIWNTRLRDHLVRTQAQGGHEDGSWHFKDEYGDVGGRLYTTAMCVLTLEVYYRYLPMYDKPDEFPL